MTLRFEVDQADAFRRGINLPKSTVHLDVDPSKLPAEERNLIADRLNGIDVCRLHLNPVAFDGPPKKTSERIQAKDPTYEALLAAVKEDANNIEQKRKEIQTSLNLAKAGKEECPSCHEFALQLVRIEKDPPHALRPLGMRNAYYKCGNCQKDFSAEV